MNYRGVLFDLDGTLLDTAPDFIHVVNMLLQEDGKPTLSEPVIRQQVSNGARALVQLAFGVEAHEPRYPQLRERLLSCYANHLSAKTVLFPGLDALLERLEHSHIPWGIVTNKPRQYADPLLKDLKLNERCQSLVCPDDVKQRKPDPEGLFKAAQEIGAQPQHCLYIGDHERDIVAGKRAGMTTMAALYGYIDDSETPTSWEADHYVEHGDEIAEIIFSST